MKHDTRTDLRKRIEKELTGNILPFWMTRVPDEENGGFYGALTNDLQILNNIPRSAILCSRILWTFAAAFRAYGNEGYLRTARRAYDYLTSAFWDQDHGGLYWLIDRAGQPVADRKHHYAQAFGIYGLAEFYQATGEPESLHLAQSLFERLETRGYDPVNKGYIEGSSRTWEALDDMRLSEKEINCRKSMNTMLHILEAYTNLLRVWDDAVLKAQHRSLIEVFRDQIIDPGTSHFKLFFDDEWHSLSGAVSYGHDIEGSWLLWEAVELQGDPDLSGQILPFVNRMASAVLREGAGEDGRIFNEMTDTGRLDRSAAWWSQVEGMVGFFDAFERTGEESYADAAQRCWRFIEERLVDPVHGDWYKLLDEDSQPDDSVYKVGPWECPYHHSRGCLEMIRRLRG